VPVNELSAWVSRDRQVFPPLLEQRRNNGECGKAGWVGASGWRVDAGFDRFDRFGRFDRFDRFDGFGRFGGFDGFDGFGGFGGFG
jgi:hypothetical protein